MEAKTTESLRKTSHDDQKSTVYGRSTKDLAFSDIMKMIIDKQDEVDRKLKEIVKACLGK